MCKVLVRSVLLSLALVAGAQAASVVFLNPGHAQETFWVSYSRFMQAAASDLGLDLRVEYGERQNARLLARARAVLQGNDRPDYLVLVNEEYVAPEILRMSRGSGVKLVLVNNGLTPGQAQAIAAQPQKYGEVLATLVSDDEQAGYRLLRELVAQLPAGTGPVDLVAFVGAGNTPASRLREQGMRRALADFPQVRLRQVARGDWNRQRAFEQSQTLVQRYPKARLVWAANDEMAFGAMRAFEQAGRVPGRDVLFGAINSSEEALRARIDGRLSALLGGHFTVGGLAMVVLSDDAHGVPMALEGQGVQRLPVMQVIDPAKARRWLEGFAQGNPDIDFRQYSAEGRGTDYRYPFLTSPVE